jgi:hypothetical protein
MDCGVIAKWLWRQLMSWAIIVPMQDDEAPSHSGMAAEIEAPVSSWFYKRCLLLGLLLGGMALYFCYDGFVGYPKQNRNADLYDIFQQAKAGESMEAMGRATKEVNSRTKAAYRAGAEGRSWAAYAATLHLPAEPPQRHSEADMATQKRIALALGLCVVLAGIWTLGHRGRVWSMKGKEIRTPWGTRFAASSITDIDRRRWDRGIALLISNDKDRFLKLKLDDYKYQGAGRIIEAVSRVHPEVRIDPPLVRPSEDDSGASESEATEDC